MCDMINWFILVILSISTLIQVADMCGFLPDKLRRKFRINRTNDMLEVLKELGVNINLYKRSNVAVGIPADYDKGNSEMVIKKKLQDITIHKKMSIGKIRSINFEEYIDLIGYTCKPENAQAYARLLSSYWRNKIGETENPSIDFVVTPKGGSPMLGYEFAKLIRKPFVMHEEEERFKLQERDMREKFDCAEIPESGSIALIVDDSTTGGRKVLETIQDLHDCGYRVTECLVVFEPQVKDARKKLKDQGVNLLSIVKTHKFRK